MKAAHPAPPAAQAAPGSLPDVIARLERLPLGWPVGKLILVLSLGCFFENYFLQMTAYIAPGMIQSGVYAAKANGFFDVHSIGFFILSGFAGMLVGSSLFGFFADRFGRRPMFVWSMLWYSATTAMMALQDGAVGMNFWRFLSSIGLGLELVVVNTYVTELVASRIRGRAVAIYQVIALSAVPLSAFVSFQLTPLTPWGIAGWRWVMWLGVLCVVLIWWFRRRLPESPRWLASMGREAEADAVVAQIERDVIAHTGKALAPAVPVPLAAPLAASAEAGTFGELFRAPYRRRTVMFVIQQLAMPVAFYGFAAWVPTLLIAKGIAVTQSMFYAFLIALAQPLSPFVMLLFADRFDRKWQIAFGGTASALLILGFALQTNPLLVVLFGIAVTFSKTIITTAVACYMPECYPTRIRGRGHGLVYGVSRVMAAMSGPIIAFALSGYGIAGVSALIGGCFLVVAGVTMLLGPRVRGRTLEQINPS
ncbi:MAG: MFS transporter [Pseudomonadota bacterium]